jgi:hypothetical protein
VTEEKGGQFRPGQSGNPKGRPAGSRSKMALALDALADGAANDIVRAMIDKAKEGDAVAARTILDRVWPARKSARIQFDLPSISRLNEIPAAIEAINRQVADGDLSPEEGAAIVGLLEAQRRTLESNEIIARIEALEARLNVR